MQRLLVVRDGVESDAQHLIESSKQRHSVTYWIHSFPIRVRLCVFAVVLVCILTTGLNFYQLQSYQLQRDIERSEAVRNFEIALMGDALAGRLVVITDEKVDRLLVQPLTVLRRLGYQQKFVADDPEWDIFWSHYYPFTDQMSDLLDNLQPFQKVNHFPGTWKITQKLELATSNISRVPTAFRLPTDTNKLRDYARSNPNALFVQKAIKHRGIRVMKLDELDLTKSDSFVQEFIANPLLIEGRMFDVGVYIIITSVDPLRVYIYEGEAVIRFCTERYHPFNAAEVDKYVIGSKYLSPWDIESLQEYYVGLGLSMKDTMDAYIKSMGKQPRKIWKQIEKVVRQVFYQSEATILASTRKYESKRSFFEMFRADFIVNENLDVFLMEVNFSPNLALGDLTVNRQRYEQLLFNTLSLVNVGRKTHPHSLEMISEEEEEMQVCDKNLAVFPEMCTSQRCRESCESLHCQLCKKCWTTATRQMLQDAYLEHGNRLDCKRIVPPTMDDKTEDLGKQAGYRNSTDLTPANQLMHLWFEGKCHMNRMWCS